MKCFYHNDLDGKVAAYWVKENYITTSIKMDLDDFIPLIHDKYDWEDDVMNKVEPGEPVYIVDFSFDPPRMEDLMEKVGSKEGGEVIWIDHHITAINKYAEYYEGRKYDIKGIRMSGISACELTWIWFNNESLTKTLQDEMDNGRTEFESKYERYGILQMLKDADCPLFTMYVGDHDIFRFGMDHTKEFILGIGTVSDTDPYAQVWYDLDTPQINKQKKMIIKFIKMGSAILKYCSTLGKVIIDKTGFTALFEDYDAYIVNSPIANVDMFKDVYETHDLFIAYYIDNGGIYRYQLRSSNPLVNCGEIAAKYGGGGHNGAAGFAFTRNLFAKPDERK